MAVPGQLTEQQKIFCRAYLESFNGSKAYKQAYPGVKDSTARANASKLLSTPEIQAYLSELKSQIGDTTEQTIATAAEVLAEATAIALSSIGDVLDWTGDEVTLRDKTAIPEAVQRAIESITCTEQETADGRISRKVSVKMHGKIQALQKLFSYHGLDSDWNQAIATLRRYGVAVIPDPSSPVGHRLDRHDPFSPDAAQVVVGGVTGNPDQN